MSRAKTFSELPEEQRQFLGPILDHFDRIWSLDAADAHYQSTLNRVPEPLKEAAREELILIELSRLQQLGHTPVSWQYLRSLHPANYLDFWQHLPDAQTQGFATDTFAPGQTLLWNGEERFLLKRQLRPSGQGTEVSNH